MKPSNEHSRRNKSPVHRHHVTGMTADELMKQFIKNVKGQFTPKDVEKVFKEQGYAAGTVSSRLSMAKSKKLIKTIGNPRSGVYEKV